MYVVAIVHVGTIVAVLAPLDYNRSAWRATEVGRALMSKWVSLAALFVVSILNFWWPFPEAAWLTIYAATLTLVVGSMTWQWRVMRAAQKQRGDADTGAHF